MKFAIDLDNTLLDYEAVYEKSLKDLDILDLFINVPRPLNKNSIKDTIKSCPSLGNSVWIKFQGKCYGKYINEASFFENAINTLRELKSNGNVVEIVSHKSKISLCGNYNLVEPMKRILEDKLPEIIFSFHENLQEKIEYIENGQFDIILDDLDEVLDKISSNTLKIKYGHSKHYLSFSDWKKVSSFGRLIKKYHLKKLSPLQRTSFKNDSQNLIIKYFADTDRLYRESKHLEVINRDYSTFENFLIVNRIPGEAVKNISFRFKTDFDNFIQSLRKSEVTLQTTHNTKSSHEYCEKILKRSKSIESKPLKEAVSNYLNNWKKSKDNMTLGHDYCLPDLCSKNMLLKEEHYLFFDFESAGYGSPERAFLNFINHPSHTLSTDEEEIVLDSYISTYRSEFSVEKALHIQELNQLEWCIIIYNYNNKEGICSLNDFFDKSLKPKTDLNELLRTKIKKN